MASRGAPDRIRPAPDRCGPPMHEVGPPSPGSGISRFTGSVPEYPDVGTVVGLNLERSHPVQKADRSQRCRHVQHRTDERVRLIGVTCQHVAHRQRDHAEHTAGSCQSRYVARCLGQRRNGGSGVADIDEAARCGVHHADHRVRISVGEEGHPRRKICAVGSREHIAPAVQRHHRFARGSTPDWCFISATPTRPRHRARQAGSPRPSLKRNDRADHYGIFAVTCVVGKRQHASLLRGWQRPQPPDAPENLVPMLRRLQPGWQPRHHGHRARTGPTLAKSGGDIGLQDVEVFGVVRPQGLATAVRLEPQRKPEVGIHRYAEHTLRRKPVLGQATDKASRTPPNRRVVPSGEWVWPPVWAHPTSVSVEEFIG